MKIRTYLITVGYVAALLTIAMALINHYRPISWR